jgi:hypothetical protein
MKHRRIFYLAAAVFLGAVLATSRFVEPSDLPPVLCLPKEFANIPCLTTGLTHSFHAAANGQWAEAVNDHPLGPFFFGLTIVLFGASCLRLAGWKRRLLPVQKPDRALFYGSLLLLFLWWAVRLARLVISQ